MEGETKCSAFINVLPPSIAPEPMITQSTGFSPEFIQLFSDTKTSIGSTIKFEARIIGTQPLNVNKFFLFNNMKYLISFFSRFTGYLMVHQ
jgi:hypothetical protein